MKRLAVFGFLLVLSFSASATDVPFMVTVMDETNPYTTLPNEHQTHQKCLADSEALSDQPQKKVYVGCLHKTFGPNVRITDHAGLPLEFSPGLVLK